VIVPVLRDDEIALLLYIDTYTRREGHAPATRDMRAAMNMTQRALYRRLSYLEAWGFIARERRRVRGVRVLRLPDVDGRAA
jgi:SOS-response transcriptional repressor LexA